MTVTADDVAGWQGWIGREERRAEIVDAEAVRRFAAAIGEDLDVGRRWPSLGHWGLFLPVAAADQVGEDGHPKRGGFLPPVSLPRRMFASATMTFHRALTLGMEAERVSRIADVRHRSGGSGDLILIDVAHVIAQAGEPCIEEMQTIVYRGAGGATPVIVPSAPVDGVRWAPTPVDLFRFSAATFNGHRIHYDAAYARDEEGYPALVVHGPFTAAKLFGLARARGGEATRFSFRAEAPIFLGQPIALVAADGEYRAIRADGRTGMSAKMIHSADLLTA